MESDETPPQARTVLEVPAARFWSERSRLRAAFGWGLLLAYLVPCLTSFERWGALQTIAWTFVVPALLTLGWFLVTSLRKGPAQLSVEKGALTVTQASGKQFVLSSFDSGFVVVREELALLELLQKGGTSWHFAGLPAREAEALLQALGLDVGKRRVALYGRDGARPMVDALLWFVFGVSGTCVLFGVLHGLLPRVVPDWQVGIAMIAAVFVMPVVGFFRGRHWQLEAGSDGVLLRTRIPFRKKFFPRARLLGVEAAHGELLLFLQGGERFAVPYRLLGIDHDEATALAERIRTALNSEAAPVHTAALSRNGRSFAEWKQALASLLEQTAGYRHASLDRSALLQVLTDADAGIEARLGAALALAARKDDHEARAQIRAVAETVVHEPVRAALVSIAADAEPEVVVERALRETART